MAVEEDAGQLLAVWGPASHFPMTESFLCLTAPTKAPQICQTQMHAFAKLKKMSFQEDEAQITAHVLFLCKAKWKHITHQRLTGT